MLRQRDGASNLQPAAASVDGRGTIVRGGASRPRIRAVAASGLDGVIKALGADPAGLLGPAHLHHQALAEPHAWLDLAGYCGLLEALAEAVGSRDFGLGFGLAHAPEILGDLGALARLAPSLHAALDTLSRYLPTLQEQTAMRFERHGADFRITYQIRDGAILRRRQDAELTVGVLIGFIRGGLGPQWRPREVHLEHPRPDPVPRYDDHLGAPVYFGQVCNSVIVTPDDAATILRSSDPVRMAELEQRLCRRLQDSRADDFVGIVLQEIRDAMVQGHPGIGPVARRLDMSGPALYRRLKRRGVEFSDLQRDLRRELALLHVADPHIRLTEVAMLLGYSELSAFSRAFRSWTGVAAMEYRRAAPR